VQATSHETKLMSKKPLKLQDYWWVQMQSSAEKLSDIALQWISISTMLSQIDVVLDPREP